MTAFYRCDYHEVKELGVNADKLIFELLAEVRKVALKERNWKLLREVEKAEKVAMKEIHGAILDHQVSLNSTGDGIVVEWPSTLQT